MFISKNVLPLGWAEYTIIALQGIVSASAPYVPNESFFIRGRNILFLISPTKYLEGGICPTLF